LVREQVLHVKDGNTDVDAIRAAIAEAKAETSKPTLIKVSTLIGYGSPNKADSHDAHGSPLGADETKLTRENLKWPYAEFEVRRACIACGHSTRAACAATASCLVLLRCCPVTTSGCNPPVAPPVATARYVQVPDEVYSTMRDAIVPRGAELESEWNKVWEAYKSKYAEPAAEFESIMTGKLPEGWEKCLPKFTPEDKGLATRQYSQVRLSFLRSRQCRSGAAGWRSQTHGRAGQLTSQPVPWCRHGPSSRRSVAACCICERRF
jgi:transketolase